MAEERLTAAGRLTALFIGLTLALLIAEAVLRYAVPGWRDFDGERLIAAVPTPEGRALSVGVPHFRGFIADPAGDFRVRVALNDFGLRSSEPVGRAAGRIWALGGATAFGWGVEEDEAFSAVAGRLLGSAAYNLARPRGGVCELGGFLARLPGGLKPRAAILAVEEEDFVRPCRDAEADPLFGRSAAYTLARVVWSRLNARRRHAAATAAAPAPTTEPGAASSERQHWAARAHDEIRVLRKTMPDRSPLLVLIVPGRASLDPFDASAAAFRASLVRSLGELGVDALDAAPLLVEAGVERTHHPHDGRWSSLGHLVAGEAVARWLESRL